MSKELHQLERFQDEVLNKGIESLLPQNLSDEWLQILSEEAEKER